ncbi:hypothetical protein HN51_018392 [Arachis hypogaea]
MEDGGRASRKEKKKTDSKEERDGERRRERQQKVEGSKGGTRCRTGKRVKRTMNRVGLCIGPFKDGNEHEPDRTREDRSNSISRA